jgi:hypothetical protein
VGGSAMYVVAIEEETITGNSSMQQKDGAPSE